MTDELAMLESMVRESHGHREAAANQKLREGDLREAERLQAEADTFRRVLHAIEKIRAGTDYTPETDAYPRISEAMRAAEKEVSERNGEKQEPGLE